MKALEQTKAIKGDRGKSKLRKTNWNWGGQIKAIAKYKGEKKHEAISRIKALDIWGKSRK